MVTSNRMIKIRFRCWIDIDGEKFFGPGPAQLLVLIDQEGSIAKAAKKMDMSYKKAWDIVNSLNTRGQEPFVVSRKGGEKGGGAKLTESGKRVLEKYYNLISRIDKLVTEESELKSLI